MLTSQLSANRAAQYIYTWLLTVQVVYMYSLCGSSPAAPFRTHLFISPASHTSFHTVPSAWLLSPGPCFLFA